MPQVTLDTSNLLQQGMDILASLNQTLSSTKFKVHTWDLHSQVTWQEKKSSCVKYFFDFCAGPYLQV